MNWLDTLMNNVTTAEELKEIFSFTDEEVTKLNVILETYPMSISRYYLSLIDKNDINDPIRKMCIPDVIESDLSGSSDTSGEATNTKLVGLQHKYAQTALILSTSSCAMYCRHCFRKRMVGTTDGEVAANFDEIMEYIKTHEEISNVIVSGGDAFLNDNSVIEKYLKNLTSIEHLDFIRFGTRTPVVLPERIYDDNELLGILEKYNKIKTIYVVTQFNHPKEITKEAKMSVEALEKIGITVKNQAVLLKGVNNNPATMATLLRKLTAIGVDPYYVFQCRPVIGVKNQFQIPILEGYKIIEEAKSMLNGFAKGFNFVMSHETGKMEFLGTLEENKMLFRYQEAKDPSDYGKTFEIELKQDQCWL